MRDFTRAIELGLTDADIHFARGSAYQSNGQPDKAIADFGKTIQLDPKHLMAHAILGEAYEAHGKQEKAIPCYTKAIQLDPQGAQYWCNRGSTQMQRGRHDKALVDYNQALQLDPNDPIALVQRFVAAANVRLQKQGSPPKQRNSEKQQAQQTRQTPTVPENEDGQPEEPAPPPSARRVATRALVLSAITYRAQLENYAGSKDAEPFRRQLLAWLDTATRRFGGSSSRPSLVSRSFSLRRFLIP